ncbi:MAG: repeat-containing protein, partial [Candidatus Berkelbacteria bacterium]|nr:repeat-containing protein [Candidatus Berkelbacteria bacterium]
MKKFFSFNIIILILLFTFSFCLLFYSSNKNSLTTDEGVHLFAGYTYLTKNGPHAFRLDPEHPPIIKELAALPLLFIKNIKTPMDGLWAKTNLFYYDAWRETRTISENFLYNSGNNPEQLKLLARMPLILLTLGLGLCVFFWSKKLYGTKAGIFAAFLILLMPSVLAHGPLINTDLGLTLFFFLAVYFWCRFLREFTWKNLIFVGFFMGLAFSSKFTSVILLPVIVFLTFIKKVLYNGKSQSWLKYFLGIIAALIISMIFVWATYGFNTSIPPKPAESPSTNIRSEPGFMAPTTFDKIFEKVRPVLAPAQFFKGLILVGKHAVGGHSSFLLGQSGFQGWWYYFPVAIFYKTPIPFFAFLILSIIYTQKLKSKDNFEEMAILVSSVIFLFVSMFSKADLGVRHILPIFPFLCVFASKSINLIDFSKMKLLGAQKFKLIPTLIFIILILWYLFTAVKTYPNYIA